MYVYTPKCVFEMGILHIRHLKGQPTFCSNEILGLIFAVNHGACMLRLLNK